MSRKRFVVLSALAVTLVVTANAGNVLSVAKKTDNGIVMSRDGELLKVEFVNPAVVRVQYVPEGQLTDNGTIVCLPRETRKTAGFKCRESKDKTMMKSGLLTVEIDHKTGAICYKAADGRLLLKENGDNPRQMERIAVEKTIYDDSKSKVEKTANGDLMVSEVASRKQVGSAWKARQQFQWQQGEALYGLGSHQEDYMNLRGTMQYLYQHNLKATIPVLMSTNGYGLLFDAGSTMVFHDDAEGSYMQMDAVNEIDYYFMYGPEMDDVVAQYRSLTGKVGMMPRYLFGYVQSKERYPDQHTIDSVVTRFRNEQIPLDVIVQDWNYWQPKWWGHKKFRADAYPDPKGMIDGVHSKNARFMLSLWPTANGNEGQEMGAKGYVLGRGIYDAYNPDSRKMYWDEYVNKNLFAHGVDAWWCDGSEPIDGDWNAKANDIAYNPKARYELNTRELHALLGIMRSNTFSLNHSRGVYENQRLTTNDKRVVNLTRSTYAGQQRYGTIVWNGDTKATWHDFAQQIPSGLNYMITGSPYWTIDAGAFFVKSSNSWFWKGNFQKGTMDMGFREFYVRNLQFCQWLPLMRSHGTDCAREPWQFGKPGEMFYDAILQQINLRYRLLPYNYSVAASMMLDNRTMTRPLVFDFRDDTNVYDIKDQLLFGPAFMACPVTGPMYYEADSKELSGVSKSRRVYLPKGTEWTDFYTGKRYEGGSLITAAAPIDRIPVFVRAGSIVPMGPLQQYSSEKPDAPWEIRIYPGADGEFTVYEDEGDNYNYEQGKYSTYTLRWNDRSRRLTISERKGSFSGMTKSRRFHIVIVGEGRGTGVDITTDADATIEYDGTPQSISLTTAFPVKPGKAVAFGNADVRLSDSWVKQREDLDIAFLKSLDPDRLLHNFRTNAGLASDAQPLEGWESPKVGLRGHFVGHYLSAVAAIVEKYDEPQLKKNLQYLTEELQKCQNAFGNGYLSAFPEKDFTTLETKFGGVWAPYYTYHKLMQGLLDVYTRTHNKKAYDMVKGMADYACNRMSKLDAATIGKMMDTRKANPQNEMGAMNEVLYKLYRLTSDPKHLALAKMFDPDWFSAPLAESKDILSGLHSNTHIVLVNGFARRYGITGEEQYRDAALNFWNMLTQSHSYANGSSSGPRPNATTRTAVSAEHWGFPCHLCNTLSGEIAESCVSHNTQKLNAYLFSWTADPKYADAYMNLFYNAVLPVQSNQSGSFVYHLPLGSPRTKKYLKDNDFFCCSGSSAETFTQLNNGIYYHDDSTLWVNMYIPSVVEWKEKKVSFRQDGNFPKNPEVSFEVSAGRKSEFAVKLFVPAWAHDVEVYVNDVRQDVALSPSSYCTLKRTWRNGDKIRLRFSYEFHVKPMPDNKNMFAIFYGPMMLAFENCPELLLEGDVTDVLRNIEMTDEEEMTFRLKNGGNSYNLRPLFDIDRQAYGVYFTVCANGCK